MAGKSRTPARIDGIVCFMAADPSPKFRTLFRQRGSTEGERVEFIELFFDLVFVFAVTRFRTPCWQT